MLWRWSTAALTPSLRVSSMPSLMISIIPLTSAKAPALPRRRGLRSAGVRLLPQAQLYKWLGSVRDGCSGHLAVSQEPTPPPCPEGDPETTEDYCERFAFWCRNPASGTMPVFSEEACTRVASTCAASGLHSLTFAGSAFRRLSDEARRYSAPGVYADDPG